MSTTATEEPPKTTEATPTPDARKAEALSFLRPKVTVDGVTTQAPEPVKPKAEEPPKQEEKKPEETKPAEAKIDPKEVNIGELRKSRDEERKLREELQKQFEAEKAERAKLLAEYEEHKKKPASEEFLKKFQELEEEKKRIDQELRAAALERSPSFRKEFNDRINANANSMVDLMVASGVDRNEAVKAINTWDENRFAEYSEGMTAPQKIKFNAAWMQAEQIENDRKAALANADVEYKKREEQAQQQQKAQFEQHQQFLKQEEESMFKDLFATEGLRENAELQNKAREAVQASYQMPPKQLMHAVATSRILADAVLVKEQQLKDMQAKLDEASAKLAEQEEFIKNAQASTARLSPTDAAATPEDRKAKAQSFLNPTVKAN